MRPKTVEELAERIRAAKGMREVEHGRMDEQDTCRLAARVAWDAFAEVDYQAAYRYDEQISRTQCLVPLPKEYIRKVVNAALHLDGSGGGIRAEGASRTDADTSATNPAAPDPCRSAWLIERGQSENHAPTVWWRGVHDHDFTPDANLARRFRTREEAQAALDKLSAPCNYVFGRVTEHVFLSPDPMPATGLEPRGCPTPGACSCPVQPERVVVAEGYAKEGLHCLCIQSPVPETIAFLRNEKLRELVGKRVRVVVEVIP
jgi:hypothetical protein